ncbi:hypothetical protein T484DRAFT_1956276 [Baffinella frigidus]|nr:hypothetical protein T484DRAFT_1956276 [Cryptophyta sp. CCMP2293]|mmetsp:Transcript_57341/g.135389  ORF Transcript_57341/g.135389 Transcript_57341/m.135389 type:complete len:207 (-) Transcript_57341:77-697(-)
MAPKIAEVEAVIEKSMHLSRAEEEEERKEKRQAKLEEMRVMEKLKNAREGLKVVRRRSVSLMEECSSTISDYYKSIDTKDLSSHIKSRFDAWDADHSQALDVLEMTEALAAMGKRPTPDEVAMLMLRVDKDGNGKVELDEFDHMVRESLNLHLESCWCRMCEAGRKAAAETEAAEAAEAARLEKEAAKAAKAAAAPAPAAKGKAGK